MKNVITSLLILFLLSSNAFSADLLASDIDPSNMIEQVSIIVGSIVSFLGFIMGSRKVLNFIG